MRETEEPSSRAPASDGDRSASSIRRPPVLEWATIAAVLAMAPLGCTERPARGALTVVSFPRGEVVIDGRASGSRTPLRNLPVPSGAHRVEVVAPGVRFEPQRVSVRPERTTHLYFRARDGAGETPDAEVCRRGREDHCWSRIDAAVRAGDEAHARRLGETYLARRAVGGYAPLVRTLLARLAPSR